MISGRGETPAVTGLIGQGLSNDEITGLLFIAGSTARTHVGF